MSSVLQLNYFVENESAESATKNFAVILQKAFEQYRSLWNKYLDLVKRYEDDVTTREQSQETWKEKNVMKSKQILSENINIFNKCVSEMKLCEKEDKTCGGEQNKNIIEDMLELSNLDYESDICDTTCQSQTPHKRTENIILPESPIFMRKDEKLISTISKSNISTSNDNKINSPTMATDEPLDFNKQNNDNSSVLSEKYVNNMSFDSLSPTIICNTPIGNDKCYKKKKQRLLKKQIPYKSKKELKENAINPKKQQVNEKNIPLQALENFISSSKVSLNHNENKTRAGSVTEYSYSKVSPENIKLKQTTLSFHTIKNKIDNDVVKSVEKNMPLSNCKKFLFKCKSYAEGSSYQNEATSDKKIDAMYIGNTDNQNETIHKDIIANSPNSIQLQPQSKNLLKLKRKFSDTDNTKISELSKSINEFNSVFNLSCTSPTKTQHQTNLTNKQNILDDSTISFTSGIIVNNAKKKCLKLSTDTQLKQKPTKNNDFDETTSIDHESSLLDVFQSGNEDETYFEDHNEEEKNVNINGKLATCHVPTHKTLTDTHYELQNPRGNNKKGSEIKTKEGWSCWECAEYYKNKPNLSEKNLQKWKNQCSRHKNIYYAGRETPEGFWDPLFPPTATDSIQET